MMKTSQPVTDCTLIDYLRLATFDIVSYYKLSAQIERKWSSWRPHKWLQYKGRKNQDGIFHGMGDQGKRAHCVISVSGSFAHLFYLWFAGKPDSIRNAFYCTRIDLQRTQSQPVKEYRVTAHKRLRGKKSLIQSDTGTTLYIGSRTSDTFWRLYDKTETHMRCELETKGRMAKRLYMALCGGESIAGVWNRILLRSKVPNVYVEYFCSHGEPAVLPDLTEPTDLESTIQWLATLDSLVYKLINDDDVGERATTIVARWAAYADLLDNSQR